MKDDKFKRLSDDEIGKISGGVSHETKGFLGIKSYENYDFNGDLEKITSFRPLDGHLVISTEEQKELEKNKKIETINHSDNINNFLDTRK